MATKKAGGSTANGRDSWSKRRGVKRYAGEAVNQGEILIRQKGSWYRTGQNTYTGVDWTIHAGVTGIVAFKKCRKQKFNGSKEFCTVISVVPAPVGSTSEKTKRNVAVA